MNHSMVNYSVCNPPKRKKVFDLLQMDTHVNVALHNCILLLKLFWPTVRKNWSSDREKLLKFEAEGREFFKIFEITWTIYSNSERSE